MSSIPIVKRSTSLSGSGGLLSKKIVNAGERSIVYKVPKQRTIAYVSLRLINVSNNDDVKIKVWICPFDVEPELIDIIEPELIFNKNDIYISSGLSLSTDEAIFIETTDGPIVCRVEGYENVVPI